MQSDVSGRRRAAVRARGWRGALLLLAAALLAGCSTDALLDRFRDTTPRERYVLALRSAGLDRSALGRDWIAAGDRSLAAPLAAALPVHEAGFFPAGEATAVAYRITAPVGRRLHVRVDAAADPGTRLFVELYAAPRDSAARPRLVVATDSLRTSFGADVDHGGALLLRIQPELLRAVRYTVVVEDGPSLAFPVTGKDSRAVQSFWGVERDGGARRHEGIDIFAPRGTPVVAAADGVARVSENALGGHVVFVYDPVRGQSLYYAHLSKQVARSGDRVRVGDTLGLVGNTGNARTTPPHLHFGIYRAGGAVDPFPFVDTRRADDPPIGADAAWVGQVARTSREATLRAGAAEREAAVRDVPSRTVLVVDGAASRGWLRVRLPDATVGYVVAAAVEPTTRPVAEARVAAASALRSRPAADAPPIDIVARTEAAPVFGRYDGFVLVEVEGRRGWIAEG